MRRDWMETETQGTYTRGKILKRVGIGAAAAWSVPFLASTASAHTTASPSRCHRNGGVTCPDTGYCSASCGSKNGLTCGCAPAVNNGVANGCCKCVGNVSCADSAPC